MPDTMTDKQTPTARPWRTRGADIMAVQTDEDGNHLVIGCVGKSSSSRSSPYSQLNKPVDAAHIVKAVNAYDDLMELVEAAGRYVEATTLVRANLSIEELAVHQSDVMVSKHALETILNKVKGGV